MRRQVEHSYILNAKQAYIEGKNIIELLRTQTNKSDNTAEIIEIAYDLQAGTYIEYVKNNFNRFSLYASELATLLNAHLDGDDSLLDIGTGELTTLSLLSLKLTQQPKTIFAFDISWSRIYKGLDFARQVMGSSTQRLVPFVANMSEIPLLDKSVDITTSSHALEPNGGKLSMLLSELFRVTAKKLVLFEPCYEINSDEGKQRMDKLGYIKDVEGEVKKLGGTLIEKTEIKHTSNPLNPTACFVIEPPFSSTPQSAFGHTNIFSVPGTNEQLKKIDNFYFSNKTGLCFPILKSIPILKSNASILASALED